jgi:hypothetical protein
MLLPILEERRPGAGTSDALIKTINTRIAGGRREINKEPSQVGLDEFAVLLTNKLHSGHRRHARIPIDTAFTSPRVQFTSHTGNFNRRRLHPHTRHMCRTKEFIRSGIEFQ